MKILRIIRNYVCYCGIEKDEYNAVKKDAYVSNFKIWRTIHCLLTAVFAVLFINSLLDSLLVQNKVFYLIAFLYFAIATVIFFVVKKDPLQGQKRRRRVP